MNRGHMLAITGALALIGVLWWSMQHPTGHMTQPQKQANPDDDLARMTNPHPDYPLFCQPEQHHAGYVYTPHRYPRVTGGEISSAIHHGFSSMRVPNVADVQWLVAPPSEVMF